MSLDIKVPVLPESVVDAVIVTWHKQVGEYVQKDENLVDIETDKIVLEVPSPEAGVLTEILQEAGETVMANQIIAHFEKQLVEPVEAKTETDTHTQTPTQAPTDMLSDTNPPHASPSVRRMLSEHNISEQDITGTGENGRVIKADVQAYVEAHQDEPIAPIGDRIQKRVPMSRLRQKIAERLLASQHQTATLTTFNEINLQPVMHLREKYQQKFEKEYGTRLGFMSFFTTAAIEALKQFPTVNASIEGEDIVYHGFFDIGIAISTERGLVVPVLKDADTLSMAEIEKHIQDFSKRANDGKLALAELTGGTFTISNGGVFGSLMSTPILNPPQSAILGMHAIQQRPVVENDEVVIRPMMYVALSYDHRIIDGKESVQFLKTIKEILEEPARLLIGV